MEDPKRQLMQAIEQLKESGSHLDKLEFSLYVIQVNGAIRTLLESSAVAVALSMVPKQKTKKAA